MGAMHMCIDIKNMYLTTILNRYKYMRFPCKLIPDEFMDAYNLHSYVRNDHIYMEIQRGMYRLPQAGILTNKLLHERLWPNGYCKVNHTPGLWKYTIRPIAFTLVVDDFRVKYVGRQHAQHPIQTQAMLAA